MNFLDIVGDVPFGNSDYQNQMFVINGEGSPARAYRHAALRIQNRNQALKECYWNLKKDELEIRRKKRKIEKLLSEKPEDYDIDIELLEVEISEKESNIPYIQKLIRDAEQEIKSLLPVIEGIGKLSRDEFEKLEENHFEKKLRRPEGYIEDKNLFKDISEGKYKIGTQITGIDDITLLLN